MCAKKGQNSLVLQCGWRSCPSWGIFMVSRKSSDMTTGSGQDISGVPLGTLLVWPCPDPAWEPWKSGATCPSSLIPLATVLLVTCGCLTAVVIFPEKAYVSQHGGE